MKITETPFEGLLIIEPDVFKDKRGFFFESFNKQELVKNGIDFNSVQDNQSFSVKNVIRGLHFQIAPHAQTKLVRALSGKILDVVVDLRKNQPTFGKVFTLELSSENNLQILVPKGFAHGFSVLSETAEIFYKCDEFYHPESYSGIIYNDSQLKIDWKIDSGSVKVSDKDKMLPTLSEFPYSF